MLGAFSGLQQFNSHLTPLISTDYIVQIWHKCLSQAHEFMRSDDKELRDTVCIRMWLVFFPLQDQTTGWNKEFDGEEGDERSKSQEMLEQDRQHTE